MSTTVGMVGVSRRRTRPIPKPPCTACGAPLLQGVAVVDARFIRNALICSGCDRVGVACTCRAAA
jgi:hypothetical protein